MMKKYSGIYKKDGKAFRYNYEWNIVEYICKASKQEIEDNKSWQEKFGKNLWDIDENGYIVVDSVGLSEMSWKDKEERDEYLGEWISEMQYECEMMAQFI